ncbi:WecB/TagA/CpsF family glycosyltransferase [Actinomycetospora soli]|uniref:WecB/TagA/CpsF family glycosyltransferase n=1 Tax=Actinomycetospora soli TaxID=2893887 RepID=UPI001E3EFB06|nr:WecB/TagA/CpsF family glycosyltransferase [Actinomycetospora soli]MCD2187841.1 WecB/TagA/CpsF family glycosyltransferase [Actinomycetospora soli]
MSENTNFDVAVVDEAVIPTQRTKNIKMVVPSPGSAASSSQMIYCARVPISACTPGVAVAQVLHLARQDRTEGADVHLCNAYTLSLADQDAAYRYMLQSARLNLADGKSVAWMNKLVGVTTEGADRVRGNDLFLDVVEQGQFHGTRHYLLGSTPEVVEKLRDELIRRFPAAFIVGVESPPFRPLTDEERTEQATRIRESDADIVWVGLGTPKQDRAAVELARDAGVVAVAIGAAFDFIAGNKPEAPTWMQQSGLEWVHRFGSEPRRLWRRYLFGNSRFVYAAYRYRRAQTHAKAVLESARQLRSVA